MALNTYFQNYQGSGEQRLIEDLILESIKIYGVETFYLPRTLVNRDLLFTEDTISQFKDNYPIEMYIKNVEGFEGEGTLLSKFGLEIRDQTTLTVSIRRFQEEVTELEPEITRPRPGDYIFIPYFTSPIPGSTGAIFEIKHAVKDAIFYQLGELQTFDIIVEKLQYSDERLDTGISEIDNIEVDNSKSYALDASQLTTEAGEVITTEDGVPLILDQYDKRTVDKNDISTSVQKDSSFIDFSEINPFSEGEF